MICKKNDQYLFGLCEIKPKTFVHLFCTISSTNRPQVSVKVILRWYRRKKPSSYKPDVCTSAHVLLWVWVPLASPSQGWRDWWEVTTVLICSCTHLYFACNLMDYTQSFSFFFSQTCKTHAPVIVQCKWHPLNSCTEFIKLVNNRKSWSCRGLFFFTSTLAQAIEF